MMEVQMAAVMRLLADGQPLSLARAAKRLDLSQSELRRLLAMLGDDPHWNGLGLVSTRDDGQRTLLSLTERGRIWLDQHR